ncbi:GntR family transcriptional regulator [Bordetella sp. 15P40C-2]|uniref:GntR family transcriptional regulator n=1 Tax=Bordetella sp. 15P40C-2 TaxID=2572246 RepID=UPI001321A265|nr:GntR family transcriptional regulator [Bordetella sp. 15P40C-2]MVW72086.1 GntR family transcriptional regulator [Bordetella sp. 15P40C-2]
MATTPPSSPVAFDAYSGGRQPLYATLARTLKHDIETDRYPVGSTLPTEGELALRYSVSRHTVRQALRELKDEGIISARPGVGTRVRARPQSLRFFSGINSVSELLQFVDATEMHVQSQREIVADEAWAAQLHCQPGQAWTEANIVRTFVDSRTPMSYLQVYLRPEFADVLHGIKVLRKPIYTLVEARYGIRIVEVQQEITAANLDEPMARALHAKEGQAALRITRYYLDRAGQLVQVGLGHYPSGTYTQSSRFRAHAADDE